MNRPEVLAPAGSWETLRAAVRAGADAVYFGGRSFNARRAAANFDDAQLAEAIGWLHARGVKAYITFNTILFENELEEAAAFLRLLCQIGADAVIVQDMGLLGLVRQMAPGMPVHASTQMSVHNVEGLRALALLGVRRAVLARELSAAETAQMQQNLPEADGVPMETEVFVHGALCMSVSGQCYFSAMLGGRSGNRGLCAQVCRLPFAAPGETGQALSLKDLSLVRQIPALASLGVSSLKIEGRMKRPEYVWAATRACAAAVRGEAVTDEALEELRAVFSRAGFTQGYWQSRRGAQMFGARGHDDVRASAQALAQLRVPADELPRVPVDFCAAIRAGAPVTLTARDGAGHEARAAGCLPEPARHRALTADEVRAHLQKTGGTPFFARTLDVALDDGLFLPAKAFNALRRGVLDALLAQRAAAVPRSCAAPPAREKTRDQVAQPALRVRLRSAAQLAAAGLEAAELVWLPLAEWEAHGEELARLAAARGLTLGVALPRACFGSAAWLARPLARARSLGAAHALCGNIGFFAPAREAGFAVHGDFGLNCANSAALETCARMGAADVLLSFECSLAQARRAADARAGLLLYGRLPLMLTRNCPLQASVGCAGCGHVLADRRGSRFPVLCGGGEAVELLNDRPLWMLDRQAELRRAGAGFWQLDFTVETAQETAAVLAALRAGGAPPAVFTRGLYGRGVL